MKLEIKVFKSGGSLVLRIPMDIARTKGITEGSTVKVNFDDIEVVQ